MKKITSCMIFLCLAAQASVRSQVLRTMVGRPMPDVTINNIENFPDKQTTVSAFRGKWLVLDFWNKNCKACFMSMPETDSMAKMFKGEVQFLLVGRQDRENKVRAAYERVKNKYKLDLPVAYDSTVMNQLDFYPCPVILVIDPDGILRAKTFDIQPQDIRDLMAGKPIVVPPIFGEAKYEFDYMKPLLIGGNGGPDTAFLYRSLLAKGSVDIEQSIPSFVSGWLQHYPYFQATNARLMELYLLAYFDFSSLSPYDSLYGERSYIPIVELKDSSQFAYSYSKAINLFCYSQILPPKKRNVETAQAIMQNDLKNYFGYNVSVEKRMMPCWKLTATEAARKKLKTKGGPELFLTQSTEANGFAVKNSSATVIASQIWLFRQFGPPIIDEMGIKENIDFSIDADFMDMSSIKAALQKQGISLAMSEKEMSVLVFRD